MPFKDVDKKREATKEAVRKYRETKRLEAQTKLTEDVNAPNAIENVLSSALEIGINIAKSNGCSVPSLENLIDQVELNSELHDSFITLYKTWIKNTYKQGLKPVVHFYEYKNGYAEGNWCFTEKQYQGENFIGPSRKKLSFQELCEELYKRATKHTLISGTITITSLDQFLEHIEWDDYTLHEAYQTWEKHNFEHDWKPKMNLFNPEYSQGYHNGNWVITLNNNYGDPTGPEEKRFNEGNNRFSFFRSPVTNSGHQRINPDGSFVLVWDPKFELKYNHSSRMDKWLEDMQDIIYTNYSNLDEKTKRFFV